MRNRILSLSIERKKFAQVNTGKKLNFIKYSYRLKPVVETGIEQAINANASYYVVVVTLLELYCVLC